MKCSCPKPHYSSAQALREGARPPAVRGPRACNTDARAGRNDLGDVTPHGCDELPGWCGELKRLCVRCGPTSRSAVQAQGFHVRVVFKPNLPFGCLIK